MRNRNKIPSDRIKDAEMPLRKAENGIHEIAFNRRRTKRMNRETEWAEQVLEKVRRKMIRVCEKNRDKIPYTTGPDGSYDDRADSDRIFSVDDGLNWWTNGFWSGMLWLLYLDTKDRRYLDTARDAEYRMEHCFETFYGLHHDVGFMYQPSAAADYRITGNERSRRTALHAAQLLAGRFNPAGNFIRAWNDLPGQDTRGWAIIDCMFNLSLLYWAARETGDPRYYHIAVRHADTAMREFVREDGSVNHIVEFDPWTGKAVRSLGGQGYGVGSSWTRGQAWALYGFTISYLHTHDEKYRNTAERVAEYCLANIPENGLIPIDFRQPKEPWPEDSCGACVMAGGFLELAKAVEEEEKKNRYREAALKILHAIDEHRADYSEDCDAIVQNCAAAYHSEDHDMTMNYADYYYIEALYKLKGSEFLMW